MLNNSKNLSSPTLEYGLKSPLDTLRLNLNGIWYLIIFVLSVTFNSYIIVVSRQKKNLQGPKNYLMHSFTISNLMGSILILPLTIISHFYRR